MCSDMPVEIATGVEAHATNSTWEFGKTRQMLPILSIGLSHLKSVRVKLRNLQYYENYNLVFQSSSIQT